LTAKVLILGSSGLIGHQIYNYLDTNSNFDLVDISLRNKPNNQTIQIDATNEYNFLEAIEEISPNFIINCIGILIDEADRCIEKTIFLNALLPHKLKKLADKMNARLIHMSTDCVFSGLKGSPYIETDIKDGRDIYAKTKGIGEVICNNHLTIRTSVVGPELKDNGSELFSWFMRQSNSISGFTDVYWSGVSTIELAKAVHWAIDNDLTGLYHITNNDRISKNDLLRLFRKFTNKDIEIHPLSGKNIDKSFIDTRRLINYEIPSYEKMVSDMVDLALNNELYLKSNIK
jgi:dTDP-4-dehydrorhamnose reductase